MNQLNLFSGIDNLKFVDYHQKTPLIYDAFKITIWKAMNKGYNEWSAKSIFEIIRWETSINGNDGFKINNNYTALYARMFANEYPEYKDFFKFKESKFDKLENK